MFARVRAADRGGRRAGEGGDRGLPSSGAVCPKALGGGGGEMQSAEAKHNNNVLAVGAEALPMRIP